VKRREAGRDVNEKMNRTNEKAVKRDPETKRKTDYVFAIEFCDTL